MAFSKCGLGNHAYRGPAQHMYLTVSSAGQQVRAVYRHCPEHQAQLLAAIDNRAELINYDAETSFVFEGPCLFCAEYFDHMPGAVFVTAYVLNERQDWYGRACAECSTQAILAGVPTMPREAS